MFLFLFLLDFYRPQTKFGQGNIFTPVCHSVHMVGSTSVHAGIPPPSLEQTPLEQTPWDHAPPQDQGPPWDQAPPPGAEHAGRYGQRAGGTYPTGMQSCD